MFHPHCRSPREVSKGLVVLGPPPSLGQVAALFSAPGQVCTVLLPETASSVRLQLPEFPVTLALGGLGIALVPADSGGPRPLSLGCQIAGERHPPLLHGTVAIGRVMGSSGHRIWAVPLQRESGPVRSGDHVFWEQAWAVSGEGESVSYLFVY